MNKLSSESFVDQHRSSTINEGVSDNALGAGLEMNLREEYSLTDELSSQLDLPPSRLKGIFMMPKDFQQQQSARNARYRAT